MKEQFSKIFKDPRLIPISIGVVSFGAGIGIGYILGRKTKIEVHDIPNQLELDFNVDELAEMRDFAKRNKGSLDKQEVSDILDEENRNPSKTIIEGTFVEERLNHPSTADIGEIFVANKIKEVETNTEKVKEEDKEEVVKQSIFANDDEWNYAQEIKKRNLSQPYVIHKDEFYSEEKDYAQTTMTYYAGDNIMCDQDESPVYNHADITGPLLFGHGSGDPNVVHIRNDKRKEEWEILYDPGLFSMEVLGLEIENNIRVQDVQHSKNRKFRVE